MHLPFLNTVKGKVCYKLIITKRSGGIIIAHGSQFVQQIFEEAFLTTKAAEVCCTQAYSKVCM